MNWWNERFINRRDYMLDHLDELTMTSDETLIVMLIDFCNQHQIAVDHAFLANKMKKDSYEIDDLLSQLTEKGYMNLTFKDGKLVFEIDGVFEGQKKDTTFDESLFDLFETEFQRPLSSVEFQRLGQWIEEYDRKLIGYALREALTYDCVSFDYIERILMDWKKRNFTADEYEEGKR